MGGKLTHKGALHLVQKVVTLLVTAEVFRLSEAATATFVEVIGHG